MNHPPTAERNHPSTAERNHPRTAEQRFTEVLLHFRHDILNNTLRATHAALLKTVLFHLLVQYPLPSGQPYMATLRGPHLILSELRVIECEARGSCPPIITPVTTTVPTLDMVALDHTVQAWTRNEEPCEAVIARLARLAPKENAPSVRRDHDRPKIVEIGAVLAIFRRFEILRMLSCFSSRPIFQGRSKPKLLDDSW